MDIIAKGGFSKDEVKRYEKEVRLGTYSYEVIYVIFGNMSCSLVVGVFIEEDDDIIKLLLVQLNGFQNLKPDLPSCESQVPSFIYV
jgi:hypothetical protein